MHSDKAPDDPVYLHSRREAVVILLVWVATFAWTVPYCYVYGYSAPADPAALELVFGMPAWVTWGVGVPWVVAGLVSIALCAWFIRDDDLEPSSTPGPSHR